jgi:branched-chain amino acid transport system permease protein
MIGALTTTTLVVKLNAPVWLGIAAAPVVGAALGAVLERLLIRRFYGRRSVEALLATFGVSLVMFQIAVDVFGTTPAGMETPLGALTIGQYSFPAYTIVLIAASAAMLFAMYLLFTRTKYGLLARATAQNAEMAQALGVAASTTNMLTFALGCGLAALGGGLLAPMIAVSPGMGQSYVGQAFMTVVVAGPAFISGTLVSALLLGVVSNLLSQGLTALWGITGLFVAAIVILRYVPLGISSGWKGQL